MNLEQEKSLEDKREKYPKYFEGLQTLSDYQKKLDDALDELKKTNEELGNVKNKTGKSIENINGRGSANNATNKALTHYLSVKPVIPCDFSLKHYKDKRTNDSGM